MYRSGDWRLCKADSMPDVSGRDVFGIHGVVVVVPFQGSPHVARQSHVAATMCDGSCVYFAPREVVRVHQALSRRRPCSSDDAMDRTGLAFVEIRIGAPRPLRLKYRDTSDPTMRLPALSRNGGNSPLDISGRPSR